MKSLLEFLINNKSTSVIKVFKYEAVDLDLHSGTLWANCNVGATRPEEFGDYFMWGCTKPSDYYGFKTHPFNNGKKDFDKKYFTDNIEKKVITNDILNKEYDAAYVNMGKEWHMPTSIQIFELLYHTNKVWVNNYENSSINGIRFESKINPDKYIFIPAAGDKYDTRTLYENTYVYLWGSRFFESSKTANYLFSSDLDTYNGQKIISFGYQVRGVQDK